MVAHCGRQTQLAAESAGLEGLNPRSQDLSFGLGMFRDYDFVVSLTRMPAVLIDASLRLVERLVAAEPAARSLLIGRHASTLEPWTWLGESTAEEARALRASCPLGHLTPIAPVRRPS